MGGHRMGCRRLCWKGKGLAASGWGGTWIQVRRGPLKHLVFVMSPWEAAVQRC